jgi:hypothetical protein
MRLLTIVRRHIAFIRRHGLNPYLTWASVEEATGALKPSTRFWRAILD